MFYNFVVQKNPDKSRVYVPVAPGHFRRVSDVEFNRITDKKRGWKITKVIDRR